jgi:hypothetical protein
MQLFRNCSAAPSQQVHQLAALAIVLATVLASITLTLLIPAAHSVHAGALTQLLPWLILPLVMGLLTLAGRLMIRQNQARK